MSKRTPFVPFPTPHPLPSLSWTLQDGGWVKERRMSSSLRDTDEPSTWFRFFQLSVVPSPSSQGRLPGFPGRKRKPEQSGRLEPLSTENQRNLRLSHPTRRPTRKNGLFGLDRFERFLHKKRSRTITGDKLGGLTDHLGGLSGSEPGPRRAVGPRKTLRLRSSGTGPGFAHFCAQKASGDKAVTSGDELGGLECRLSGAENGIRERLEPVFGGKRANLEAQAPF